MYPYRELNAKTTEDSRSFASMNPSARTARDHEPGKSPPSAAPMTHTWSRAFTCTTRDRSGVAKTPRASGQSRAAPDANAASPTRGRAGSSRASRSEAASPGGIAASGKYAPRRSPASASTAPATSRSTSRRSARVAPGSSAKRPRFRDIATRHPSTRLSETAYATASGSRAHWKLPTPGVAACHAVRTPSSSGANAE